MVITPIEADNPCFSENWPSVCCAIRKCLESGKLANNLEWVQRLENEVCRLLCIPPGSVVAVDHGYSALLIALRLLKLPAKSFVAVPDMTFTGAVSAVIAAGHVPCFVPVDEESLTVTPAVLNRAIHHFDSQGTPLSALLALDYLGIPCDRKGLSETCKRLQLRLVIDAAAALGAELSVPPGENPYIEPSSFSAYSFHATKPFSSGGEGGALYCPTAQDACLARQLRNFGISSHDKSATMVPGPNAKIPELMALIGVHNIAHYPSRLAKRRGFATLLRDALTSTFPNLFSEHLRAVEIPTDSKPTWWFIPYCFSKELLEIDPSALDQFRAALGVAGVTNRYYPSQSLTRAFRHLPCLATDRSLQSRLVLFPCRPDLGSLHIEHIVDSVKQAAKSLPSGL